MAQKFTFNPFTEELDAVTTIPELTSDPLSPKAEDAWVLNSTAGAGGNVGQSIGLLLSLTYPGSGGIALYQFSYKNKDGSIRRTTLT